MLPVPALVTQEACHEILAWSSAALSLSQCKLARPTAQGVSAQSTGEEGQGTEPQLLSPRLARTHDLESTRLWLFPLTW